MVTRDFISFLGAFKSGILNKKYLIRFKYTKLLIPFLNCMVNRGVIRHFSIKPFRGNSYFFYIYLRYSIANNRLVISDVRLFSVGNTLEHLSSSFIRKLFRARSSGKFVNLNQEFFFLTSFGLLPLNQVVQLNQGGFLVCRIQYC